MRVLGIDSSSSSTGLALVDGTDLIDTWIWTPKKKSAPHPQRIYEYFCFLEELIPTLKADYASIEKLTHARNALTVRILSQYQGVSSVACTQAGLAVLEPRVLEARKYGLGHGYKDKETVYKKVKKMYPKHKFLPFDKGGNDETDAVVLALAAPHMI